MVSHNIEQIPKQQCQLFLVQTTLLRAVVDYELYKFYKYSCKIFSCVSSTSRKRLQIIQNKLIRFNLGISTGSHIGYKEFSSSNMLPVEYRFTQLKLKDIGLQF